MCAFTLRDHFMGPQFKIYDDRRMCLLGALVRNPKIRAKTGNKMNEGMAAPYV